MEIESKVSVKKDNGEVISADVLLYNETGDAIKKITIIDSQELASLEETVERYRNEYVSNSQLTTILNNKNKDVTINATKIGGNDSKDIALKSDMPTTLEPTKHDSTTQTYGVGSTSRFGHVKTRNDLSSTSFINGEALSAYQGALLNNRLNNAQNQVDNLQEKYNKGNLSIQIGRLRNGKFEQEYKTYVQTKTGDVIYARVYCDNPDYDFSKYSVTLHFGENNEYFYHLDSQGYTTTDTGERGGKVIEWEGSRNILLFAFAPGDETLGVRSAYTVKRLVHNIG